MDAATVITYVGPSAYANALAEALRREGLTASFGPPPTTTSSGVGRTVVQTLSVSGSTSVIADVARHFSALFPGVEVRGLPSGP